MTGVDTIKYTANGPGERRKVQPKEEQNLTPPEEIYYVWDVGGSFAIETPLRNHPLNETLFLAMKGNYQFFHKGVLPTVRKVGKVTKKEALDLYHSYSEVYFREDGKEKASEEEVEEFDKEVDLLLKKAIKNYNGEGQ